MKKMLLASMFSIGLITVTVAQEKVVKVAPKSGAERVSAEKMASDKHNSDNKIADKKEQEKRALQHVNKDRSSSELQFAQPAESINKQNAPASSDLTPSPASPNKSGKGTKVTRKKSRHSSTTIRKD